MLAADAALARSPEGFQALSASVVEGGVACEEDQAVVQGLGSEHSNKRVTMSPLETSGEEGMRRGDG
ncbi:MAG: hypothetical protein Q4G34_01255 [Micrococcus sp.]|nr:hypothetical protein [Micrococcus sp.]